MSAAPDEEVPAYRLYTSKEAARRVGGDLVPSLFDDLARSGKVTHTRIGRKIRWTDDQLRAAVEYHATNPEEIKQQRDAARRESRTAAAQRGGRTRSAIVADPSPRYLRSLEYR